MKDRILVIEDEELDFQVLKDILQPEGFLVFHAKSGVEGLMMVEKISPDVLVLDLVLPDIDGFEVCRRVRQDERRLGMPVLFLSSSANLDNKLLGLQLGASDFLMKGCDPREIVFRIKNLLQHKRLFDEVFRQSVVDGLTHSYNRRFFQHRLIDEFERGRRYKRSFCCAIIDVDNFKEINDHYGHPVGDVVLKHVARSLRRNCRTTDIVCRYGGDEFGVLLPETSIEGAYVITERFREVIANKSISVGGEKFNITVSCGISSVNSGTRALDVDELVTQADVALYTSKRQGRNRTRVYGVSPDALPAADLMRQEGK